jgi:hypothetical protein
MVQHMTKGDMSDIPAYADSVLQEWHTIAFTAYDGYERIGRGVVGLSPQGDSTQLLYGDRGSFVEQGNTTVTKMIDAYDPEWEFLALFDTEDGNTRTIRIRTPEGGQHPKRIWFFEMLRRVTEEPESLPEELPTWFLDALDKLEKAKKTAEPEN